MKKIVGLLLLVLAVSAKAQYGYITGNVKDRFGPISGAIVSVENSPYGTFTDSDGYFAFEIDTGYHELKIQLPGYSETVINIRLENLDQKELEVELESELLDADVGIGTKTTVSQNQLESPVPIDVVYGHELMNSGHVELGSALHQLLPSFYSTKQSANDPINHSDPISLRGLGPDQILVLVNGKRRHKSAYLNASEIFGKGTSGTDLNTIPLIAIERIEILRDGASSQYGSDAIGGVINIILKDKSSEPAINAYVGVSQEGDGAITNFEFNEGIRLDNTGFINLTMGFTDHEEVNRGGSYTGQVFTDPQADMLQVPRDSVFNEVSKTFPNNTIYELGSSEYQNASFLLNSRFKLSSELDIYSFGGVNYRIGTMNSAFRMPFQEDQIVSLFYPFGFSPRVISEQIDQSLTLGVDGMVNDWFIDVSFSSASSTFDVTVENSNNASLQILSPISTFAAGYKYSHNIFGFEASRAFNVSFGELDLALGGEFRLEEYDLVDGEEDSYTNGNLFLDSVTNEMGEPLFDTPKEVGMQGYFGVQESDALEEIRTNLSANVQLDYSYGYFLLSIADRYEQYSDFGEQNNYKVAARYKFANQFLLRASYSTGFKAPSLQQLFYQRTSRKLIDGEFENVVHLNSQFLSITNFIPELDLSLKPEVSESISIGFTSSLNRFISFSVDAYRTIIKNRIGLVTESISNLDDSSLDEEEMDLFDFLFAEFELNNVNFIELYTNLYDTETNGIDAVLATQYNNSWASFHFNSKFSYIKTEVTSIDLLEGETIDQYRAESSQIESYVPQYQWMNTFTTTFNKFNITLGHIRYGESEYLHPLDYDPNNWQLNSNTGVVASRDQKFGAKDVFNLDVKYRLSNNLSLSLGGLNITNEYPDQVDHSANLNNGVFNYSPFVRQFDLRGAYYYTRINLRL